MKPPYHVFPIVNTKGEAIGTLDNRGNITVDPDHVKFVGFKDVKEIKSYRIMREGSLTIHRAEMQNGSTVEFSYRGDEAISQIKVSGNICGFYVANNEELVINTKNIVMPQPQEEE